MTTGFTITADPSGGVSAFNQISSAMRKAGQEGRKLSELDFSHPELKPLEDDIKRIQSNFEELNKTGRGATAAAVRKGNYSDAMDWHKGHGRQFPDAKQRQNHFETVSNYSAQGTRWAGGDGGSGGGNDGGRSGGGAVFGGLPIPGIGRLLGIGLGIAGIAKAGSMVSEGVSTATDEAVQVDLFKRIISDTSTEFDSLRDSLRETGNGLQLTYNETIKLAQSFAKASTYTDATRINQEVRTSAGFARAFGLDPNQTTQTFGKARFLEAGGGKEANPKEMAIMFADAIAAGGMWSKGDEVMSSIIGFVQQAERTMIDSPNTQAYARLSSSMNNSKRPGLMGQAGAALISQIDQAIRNGGGAGDAGKNFLWQSLNGDGKLDPWKMQYLLEKGGMLGTRSEVFPGMEGDTPNYELIQDKMRRDYQNPFQRYNAMSRLQNISMPAAEALDNLPDGNFGALAEMLKEFDIKLEGIGATSIQGLAGLAQAETSKELDVIRDDVLKRKDITDEQRDLVDKSEFGVDLRKNLALTMKDMNREVNDGTKMTDALTDMQRALTNQGSNLLAPIYSIKGFLAQMIGEPVETVKGIVSKENDNLYYTDPMEFYRKKSLDSFKAEKGLINYVDGVPEFGMSKVDQKSNSSAGSINYVNGVPEYGTMKVEVTLKNEKGNELATVITPSQKVVPVLE